MHLDCSHVGRYYNAMYWCLFDLVAENCGYRAAHLHVEYRIKLWEPAVTVFYCDLGISSLYSISRGQSVKFWDQERNSYVVWRPLSLDRGVGPLLRSVDRPTCRHLQRHRAVLRAIAWLSCLSYFL